MIVGIPKEIKNNENRVGMTPEGVNLYDLRTFARQMGATDALNLDGGGSSTLYIQGYGVINYPCDNGIYDHEGERAVPSVLLVKKN